MPRRLLLVLLLIVAVLALPLWMFAEARGRPVVRRLTVRMADWPAGARPVRAVLVSDIHFGNATMDAGRLDRIIDRIEALHPDLVLVAGDMIAGNAPGSAVRLSRPMRMPLRRLHAPLGVVAVLGNHDNTTGPRTVRRLWEGAGATVLENAAVVRGPLAIGGVGDAYSKHDDLPETLDAMAGLPGARLLLTHSPDVAGEMPDGFGMLLAGHTHCSQIVLPLIGPPKTYSKYGTRYRCGIVTERGNVVVVTAGVGTSELPLRFGAPPDIWLLTLGPA